MTTPVRTIQSMSFLLKVVREVDYPTGAVKLHCPILKAHGIGANDIEAYQRMYANALEHEEKLNILVREDQ